MSDPVRKIFKSRIRSKKGPDPPTCRLFLAGRIKNAVFSNPPLFCLNWCLECGTKNCGARQPCPLQCLNRWWSAGQKIAGPATLSSTMFELVVECGTKKLRGSATLSATMFELVVECAGRGHKLCYLNLLSCNKEKQENLPPPPPPPSFPPGKKTFKIFHQTF